MKLYFLTLLIGTIVALSNLRERYPNSAKVFDEMADEEVRHRGMLFDLYRSKFGDYLPLTKPCLGSAARGSFMNRSPLARNGR